MTTPIPTACCTLPTFSSMEPTTGIEPVNLILTKDVLYLLSYVGHLSDQSLKIAAEFILERETGFEPATLSLEG